MDTCLPRPSKVTALSPPLAPDSHQHQGPTKGSPVTMLPVTNTQEVVATTTSPRSRSFLSTQDRSTTAGQALSSGSKVSKSPAIPPPVKSKGPNSGALVRQMRRIIAEDAEWSLATVPLLTELCIQHIVKNFKGESVPAGGRREKARGRTEWVGPAWTRGLRGWVLGHPLPSHTESSSLLSTSLRPLEPTVSPAVSTSRPH